MKKRLGILTGGGDVQSLNSVIASSCLTAEDLNFELIGFFKGWEGVLENNFVNLSQVKIDPSVGGTILKSSRIDINVFENGPERVLENLKHNSIEGLIVIGGEDTLSNSFLIESFPQVLISKTIDNDVGRFANTDKDLNLENIINYFTLGFPTAATKMASYVSLKEGLRTSAYSHERIVILESMGMHTGWLALSSGMGFPDFIIIPEFPLDYESILEKIIEKFEKQKHLIVVVAEGALWKDGSYIFSEKDELETFSHPRFGGSSQVLKDRLKQGLRKSFNSRNINAVNPSYLYRSGPPCKLDLVWAKRLGEEAVRFLSEEREGSHFLSIQKEKTKFKIRSFPLVKFSSMEELHRPVDSRLYDSSDFQISDQGQKYFREIIQEIPLDHSYGFSTD
jgi:6-phosphofructokinase 1